MIRECVDFYVLLVHSLEVQLILELSVQVACADEVLLREVCQYFYDCFLNVVDLLGVEVRLGADVGRKNNKRPNHSVACIVIPEEFTMNFLLRVLAIYVLMLLGLLAQVVNSLY